MIRFYLVADDGYSVMFHAERRDFGYGAYETRAKARAVNRALKKMHEHLKWFDVESGFRLCSMVGGGEIYTFGPQVGEWYYIND